MNALIWEDHPQPWEKKVKGKWDAICRLAHHLEESKVLDVGRGFEIVSRLVETGGSVSVQNGRADIVAYVDNQMADALKRHGYTVDTPASE